MTLESEIAEQPAVLEALLSSARGEADEHARAIARAAHLVFVARGSSDNAATYGKYLFEGVAGLVVASAAPSLVTRYRSGPDFARSAVIAISQSGRSPDVAAVVAAARRDGASTLAITNERRSPLARAADAAFLLRCGPERSVAATKTYTASCLALALLASAAASARGRASLVFDGLTEAVAEAVGKRRDAERIARRIGRSAVLVVLGRGYDYATALEGALKIKELARVWAEPYSTADFAHGPRTLLERGTPVLVVASRGVAARDARSVVSSLRERGARVLAITNDARVAEAATDAILLERRVSETLAPIALAVAAQLVAVALARRNGRDPDRPSGLTKVTRTL